MESEELSNKINLVIEESMTGFESEQERLENIVEALRWSLEGYSDLLTEY